MLRFACKTVLATLIGIITSVVASVIAFYVLAGIAGKPPPPTAIFEVPERVMQMVDVLIEAGEKYINSP